ncbi:MAG: hypothetical protein KGV56_00110 [Gammaproteobacteria bacterium]|nr:hypothetical protein [Gammaproteobacteria bacterium]
MKNPDKVALAIDTANFLLSKECTQPVKLDQRVNDRKDYMKAYGELVKEVYKLVEQLDKK